MGSPLGPTFANIFMCWLETKIFEQCPAEFKPLFYRRYVDDTCVLFKCPSHSLLFLNFINSLHPNIQFTIEHESNNCLPFLDVLVQRQSASFSTSVYRKKTFSGLGLNFFSHCPQNFKFNSIRTLLYRAFHLSSSWDLFHRETVFLENFFKKNCYPNHIFPAFLNKFVNNVLQPAAPSYDVPKLKHRISFPFLGNLSRQFKTDINKIIQKYLPFLSIDIIFVNPLSLSNYFKFKDSLTTVMRSNLVYLFTCPRCPRGTYVGLTSRMLKVRIDSHMGISCRTSKPLGKKEHSNIRQHSCKCKFSIDYNNFKIIATSKNTRDLPILESLLIKALNPTLNSDLSSTPLRIA